MSNTKQVRIPLLVGIGVIAAAVPFALLIGESDGAEVKFDALNATFNVECEDHHEPTYDFDDVNPLTFSDGVWDTPPPYESQLDLRYVEVVEQVVAEVVEDSPGPEVVVDLNCSISNIYLGNEVHVFAGNSREARRLGEPVPGTIERVHGHVGGMEWGFTGFVSTRVWEHDVNDAGCCPSRYVIVERRWKGGEWEESEREVWERTEWER